MVTVFAGGRLHLHLIPEFLELIQHFGDWALDAYKVYLEFSLPARLQVAEKMKLRLLQSS